MTRTSVRSMFSAGFLLTFALAACGGAKATPLPAVGTPSVTMTSADTSAATAATATSGSSESNATTDTSTATASSASATAQPTNTPDNTVATAAANADNTSFATALTLGKDPVKVSVKDSEFYYKLDTPKGAVVNATLSVDAGSPEPAKLTLYNEKQGYVEDITVAVGKSGTLMHIFNMEGGTTVFFSLRGNSSVSLQASAVAQNDGGSGADAGDDTDTVTPVKLGSVNGLLGNDDNSDNYLVDLPKTGGVLSVTFQTDNKVKLTLLNAKAGYVTDNSASKNDDKPAELQTVLAEGQGGKWYLQFTGEGAYTSTVEFAGQNDAGSGKDAGDNADAAVTIKPGSYSGLLGGDDGDDYYAIDLPKTGGVLSVTFQTNNDVKLTLKNNTEGYVADVTSKKGDDAPAALQNVLPLGQGGKWYLAFHGEGSYDFNVSFTGQNDAGSGKDAGDKVESALSVSSAEFTGSLGGDDNEDYYKIPGSMGRKVSVTFEGTGTLKATMKSANGDYIADASVEGNGTTEVSDDSGKTDDYILVLSGGEGTYSVKISQ